MKYLLFFILFVFGNSYAGQSCVEKPMSPQKVQQIYSHAQKLNQFLDHTNFKSAIIVRQGQDLKKYGLHYSHAAFITKEENAWNVYHSLNLCGTAKSKLFKQGLAEFIGDDLFGQNIAVVFLAKEQEEIISKLLSNKDYLTALHQDAYNAVSYPFSTKYQNSNQWLIESYLYAKTGFKHNRSQIQAILRDQYKPDLLILDPLTRLGGRLFKVNVAFDDHPDSLRWNNKITVSSGDSVIRYFQNNEIPFNCEHQNFASNVCVLTL